MVNSDFEYFLDRNRLKSGGVGREYNNERLRWAIKQSSFNEIVGACINEHLNSDKNFLKNSWQ